MYGLRRLGGLALAAIGASALAACQETLDGGAACPSLCPGQQLEVVDTILFPFVLPPQPDGLVAIDTTLVGYPPLGTAPRTLIASRGDTLFTALVARFDTLPSRFRTSPLDTATAPIVALDSASLSVEIDTLGRIARAAVTFEVFEIAATNAEPDTAAVRAAIASASPISSRTFEPESLQRTVRIPVDNSVVLARMQDVARLRLAVVVRSDSSAQFTVWSAEAGFPPTLRVVARSEGDTATIVIPVQSRAPATSGFGPQDLSDYTAVLRSPTPSPTPSGTLAVGGLPASRAYLRFRLPPSLLDSTTIVRATLLLTQRPNPTSASAGDTIAVVPRVVIASPLLDSLEPGKAALLLASPAAAAFALQPALTAPADSGVLHFEIATTLRLWRLQDPAQVIRALVLQSGFEGYLPQDVHLFSSEAAVDSLRPRLHLVYIPSARFGLP